MVFLFAAGESAIVCQMHGAFIVLKDDIVMSLITLCLKKMADLQDHSHCIIYPHQLCLRRTPSIQLLFG